MAPSRTTPEPPSTPTTLAAALRPVRLDAAGTASMTRRGALGVVGVAAQGVVRFLTSALVGRIGGPAVLGAVQSAISTALLLSLLWPTTTGNAASKFVARARGKADPAEAAAVAAHLSRRTLQAAALLAVVAVPVWVWLDGGNPSGAAYVAVLVLGYSGYSFARGLQYGAGQIPRATTWDLLSGGLGIAGLVLALLLGARGLVLLLPLAGAYTLYAVAGWPWGARGRPARALRREMDAFVAMGVVGTLASTGFLQLSMIVARLSDGVANAGQYAAALALATPPSLLAGSLSLVLFPSMSEAWGRQDHEAFKRQTDQATRLLVVVMITIFGALVLCSRFIVALIWGARYDRAADLLPVLLLAVLATTLGVACVNSLTSRAHRGIVIASSASLVGLAVGAAVWAVLAPRLGVFGVALGYLCGTVLIAGIPIVTVWRRDAHVWGRLALRVGAGLVLLVGLLAVERGLPTSRWVDPAFAVVFCGLWLALMRRDVVTVLGLLRQRGSRPGQAQAVRAPADQAPDQDTSADQAAARHTSADQGTSAGHAADQHTPAGPAEGQR